MKHFKLPLIVTGIVFAVMIVVGVVAIVWINGLDISNREKGVRAGRLGTGIATLGCFLMAPFWLVAAARAGKERREKQGKA